MIPSAIAETSAHFDEIYTVRSDLSHPSFCLFRLISSFCLFGFFYHDIVDQVYRLDSKPFFYGYINNCGNVMLFSWSRCYVETRYLVIEFREHM